ncbi:MFS transporter, NNP family, nitrate/nitrite transporter [Alteribacillus persepolensis]|uniref:MFS transporter, NNP family, nitrate/nitrite transporter n=1 Tax=Alteribacillus persepolensis TaxID=568899 RepID=A0A1G8BZT8_9BACI|nr:nitrate/nitrite transporter [Alteribacillus persepolensis]SDH38716.1 MFS transporter, NNP family, nitrate/nitrite transporter [Alteribacillus persepolensis]
MKKRIKGQTSALVFSTFAMIISFAVWSVIAPIATDIQELYDLSELQKSLLVVTPVILGSIMRIPMGVLTDQHGGKKVYTLTMLALVLPMFAAGFTTSYSILLFFTFLIGMAGTTFAIAVTYVTRWFSPEKQGLALGITGMGNLGTAVASFTVPSIYSNFGLEWVYWTFAIAIGMMACMFWLGTKELPKPKQVNTLKQSMSVITLRQTWVLSLFYFLTFGGFIAFSLYLPAIVQETYGFSAVHAGFIVAGFVVVATCIRPLGGYLADVFKPLRVLKWLFVGIIVFASFMAFTGSSFPLFSLSCAVMAALLGAGNGAVFKLVPEVSPINTGAVTGIVSAVGGIGGFFPPVALGVIKGMTGGYGFGFLLLAVFTAGCLLVIPYISRTRNIKEAHIMY